MTGAEYLPPLPDALPDEIYADFERVGLVTLGSDLRSRLEGAAYLLFDGMHRHASQPNAGDARRRLEGLIDRLRRPGSARHAFLADISDLLDKDDLGDVLKSLLMPPCRQEPPMITLSRRSLAERRKTLLAAACDLQKRLETHTAGSREEDP